MHCLPAPLSVNCLELLDAAVICSGVGAKAALLYVRVGVATTILHAPAAKRAAASAAYSKASGADESVANKTGLTTHAPVKIFERQTATRPRTSQGENVFTDVEAVAVYALLCCPLHSDKLLLHFFDFGLELCFCFVVRPKLHHVSTSLTKECKGGVVHKCKNVSV